MRRVNNQIGYQIRHQVWIKLCKQYSYKVINQSIIAVTGQTIDPSVFVVDQIKENVKG